MKITAMLGYKLFRVNEDNSVSIIRIVDMKKYKDNAEPVEVTIRYEDTKEKKKIRVDSLKDYTPLEPDGICTFSTVNVRNNTTGKISKDVIVTGQKFLEVKYGLSVTPYCVCRQSVTDVFHSYFTNDNEHDLVGLSVNKDNMPANFDFGIMLVCDEITYCDFVNFYRMDTMDDILELVHVSKFDRVLKELYDEHVAYVKDPTLQFKEEDKGWCTTLKKLLTLNGFQFDLNEMLGITQIDFDISQYIVEKKITEDSEPYQSLTDEVQCWLSYTYGVNISETYILEYNHDINLAEFNNAMYIIVRNNDNRLFIITYTIDGEYKEELLRQKAEELDFSTKYRLAFINHLKK